MTGDDPRFDLPRRASPRHAHPRRRGGARRALLRRLPAGEPGRLAAHRHHAGADVGPLPRSARPVAPRHAGALRRAARGNRHAAAGPRRRAAPAAPVVGLRVLAAAFPILLQDRGPARPGGAGHLGVRRGRPAEPAKAPTAGPETRRTPRRSRSPSARCGSPSTRRRRWCSTAPRTGPRSSTATRGCRWTCRRPFALDPGDVLVVPPPARGMRSYLALRGGFDVQRLLGSAATDTLANIGPAPLGAGAVVGFARRRGARRRRDPGDGAVAAGTGRDGGRCR